MRDKPLHPELARLVVGLLMLALAFLGLILTDIRHGGAFGYWRWISVLYAILAVWLSWYERKKKDLLRPQTIMHELLHWVGMIAVIFLISMFVKMGILGRFDAGLFVLVTLALTVYLAGVYIETSFCFIGICLGLFAAGVAFFTEYLYAFALPVLLFGGLLAGWYLLRRKKHHTS